jgi:predicted nucleic acid-binding protein
MSVVVDSNVSISALHFASKQEIPTGALEKAVNEDIIATCDEIDVELVRVLTERFRWSRQLAELTLQRMLDRSIRVTIRGTLKLCRDPNDDKFPRMP